MTRRFRLASIVSLQGSAGLASSSFPTDRHCLAGSATTITARWSASMGVDKSKWHAQVMHSSGWHGVSLRPLTGF